MKGETGIAAVKKEVKIQLKKKQRKEFNVTIFKQNAMTFSAYFNPRIIWRETC